MSTTGKKILIVDDDSNITDMYSLQFVADGYVVEVASNVKEGRAKIASGLVPDAILLDIIMPGENGIELLEELVKNPQLTKTKIIIFSNLDQRSDIDENILKKIASYHLKVDMIPSDMSKELAKLLNT